MKKLSTFLLVFSCIALHAQSKKILFVGNSLTYYNQMPQTLQEMFNDTKQAYEVVQETSPGAGLKHHAFYTRAEGSNMSSQTPRGEDATTIKKIRSSNWDYVVLQEGTVKLLVPESIDYDVLPAALKIDSVIKAQKARTVLYQSFTMQGFPYRYCYPVIAVSRTIQWNKDSCCSATYNDAAQEFDTLRKNISMLADMLHADIAPIGAAFELCRKKYPDIMLYMSATDSHPSAAGSYLIACVFYKFFTKAKLGKVQYNAKLDEDTANKLKSVADSL